MQFMEVPPACCSLRSPLWIGRKETKFILLKHIKPFPFRHLPDRFCVPFPSQLLIAKAKFDDHFGFTSQSFTPTPLTLLTAKKAEAKEVLSLFLMKQGLSSVDAARRINKAGQFINSFVSEPHASCTTCYSVGRELSTPEIRDALVPYVESHLDEYSNATEQFPHSPDKKKPISRNAGTTSEVSPIRQRAIARMSEQGSPTVLYLIDIGLNLDQIKDIARRYPQFASCSLDNQIKPVIKFLPELGLRQEDIPVILYKVPDLCRLSLSETFIPITTLLKGYGIGKTQWAIIMRRFPTLFRYSITKVKTLIAYLSELGLSPTRIGIIITRHPTIVSFSVDKKLKLSEEYFRSLGINVASLIYLAPRIFCSNLNNTIKPITEFFLEKGFSTEEIATMASKHVHFYSYNLERNIKPKWDFFLTLGYPKSELVKYPQFFGYKLEERIKPRFIYLSQYGAKFSLRTSMTKSNSELEKILEKYKEKGV